MMAWPDLPYNEWTATRETLHMWLQIVGKIRLAKTKWVNHSWHVPLYVTSRGLTTSVIHDHDSGYSFSIDLDFISHALSFLRSDGRVSSFSLVSESVASFFGRCSLALEDLGVRPIISQLPNEVAEAIPFSADVKHCHYDREYAHRFWLALLHADDVMKEFRADFVGKVSPVHFFWGSFDLACSRFSGRVAPRHPGGVPHLPDVVTREAYSHEVSSCGFWPGSPPFCEPAFYSYCYPVVPGFAEAEVRPHGAYFHSGLGEFLLPYSVVRGAADSRGLLLEFFRSTYEAAADLGGWDRGALEAGGELVELQGH